MRSHRSKKWAAVEFVGVMLLIGGFASISAALLELEDAGMPFLLLLQQFRSDPVDVFARACSFLGFEFFFFMIPVACFWTSGPEPQDPVKVEEVREKKRESLDGKGSERQIAALSMRRYKAGLELLVLLTSTWFFLSIVKSIFARPRPYQVNSAIVTIAKQVSAGKEFSFPSGHSCGAMVCWLFLYGRFGEGRQWLGVVGTLATALSSFSRLWFAVHYPHDIVGGWIVAIVFYRLFVAVGTSAKSLLAMLIIQICIAGAVPFEIHLTQVGLLVCPGVIAAILSAMPIASSVRFSRFLTLSPLAWRVDPRAVRKDRRTRIWKRVARVVVGILGVAVAFALISGDIESAAFEEQTAFSFMSLRPFFYGYLISSWIVWIAPLTCLMLRLD